jgi:protease I
MATQTLSQKKVAILVADGFEQAELTEPKQALDDAGAQTHIVSPNSDTVQGWNHYDKGDNFPVNVTLDSANPDDYDALLLPGGVANPDQLRMNEKAVQFIQAFFAASNTNSSRLGYRWYKVAVGFKQQLWQVFTNSRSPKRRPT